MKVPFFNIKNKNSIRELLNYSLEKLSENIFILNNKPYIKESFFEEWQEIISRVSPLIIISYYLYKNFSEKYKNKVKNKVTELEIKCE